MLRTQLVLDIGAVIGKVRDQQLVAVFQFSAVTSPFRKFRAVPEIERIGTTCLPKFCRANGGFP